MNWPVRHSGTASDAPLAGTYLPETIWKPYGVDADAYWLKEQCDGSYAAIGIFGQLLYIDPHRRLVIAQVGAWPKADSEDEVAARRAFVAAIKRAVDAGTASSSMKSSAPAESFE